MYILRINTEEINQSALNGIINNPMSTDKPHLSNLCSDCSIHDNATFKSQNPFQWKDIKQKNKPKQAHNIPSGLKN